MLLVVALLLVWLIYHSGKDSMTDFNWELDNKGKMKIYDECNFEVMGLSAFGKDSANEREMGECSIAIQVIPLVNSVLEIGGGSGKVSHMINNILQRSDRGKRHVVVEPGASGQGHMGEESIEINKKNFGDQYTIIKKFAENMDISDLLSLNGPPDCLYVDCEGCLNAFNNTALGKYVLNNVRFIVNEMDGHNDELRKVWGDYGFKRIGVGYGCGTECDTEVWYRD